MEFETAQDATNAMVFHGTEYEGITLKVQQPNDFDGADFKGMLLLFLHSHLTKELDHDSLHKKYSSADC